MTQRLAKHGSEAGYRAELKTDNVCERCRNGHRVFDTQYNRRNKGKGIKYGRFDVLDHLYVPGRASHPPAAAQTRTEPSGLHTARKAPEPQTRPIASSEPGSDSPDFTLTAEPTEPSLSERFAAGLKRLTVPNDTDGYVGSDEIPDYLRTVDPDPDPADPDSSPIQDDSFVITRESMVLIEENLGTYLSVIGMTLEMVDPYCGPILAENIENIVSRWSKVIARYPSAARIFMAKGGGTIMDWIGAIQATWPVLFAIYEHHLSRTIRTEKGRVMRVMNNGQAPTVDPTMPPAQSDYAYTVN
jgi:hypothetical protein